jgi:hypothetical protein
VAETRSQEDPQEDDTNRMKMGMTAKVQSQEDEQEYATSQIRETRMTAKAQSHLELEGQDQQNKDRDARNQIEMAIPLLPPLPQISAAPTTMINLKRRPNGRNGVQLV